MIIHFVKKKDIEWLAEHLPDAQPMIDPIASEKADAVVYGPVPAWIQLLEETAK